MRAAPEPSTFPVDGSGPAPSTIRRPSPVRRFFSVLAAAAIIGVLWPAQFGGITGLTIVSGQSMEPLYRTGDLVVSVRQPDYAVGDVVSYTVPAGQPGEGGRVIHRIIGKDAVGTASGTDGSPLPFASQGDNNPDIDPWRFAARDVMGVAVLSVPGVGVLISSLGDPLVVGLGAGLLVTVVLWPKRAPDRARERERLTVEADSL